MEKLHVVSVQDELLEAFEDFGPAEMPMDSMLMLKFQLKTHSDLIFVSANESSSIKFYLQRVGCTLDQTAKDWNEFEQQHFVVQPVGEPSMSKSLDRLAMGLSVSVAYLSYGDFGTKPKSEIILLNF